MLILSSLLVNAQKNKKGGAASFYTFDSNWKAVDPENAKYLVCSQKLNDTCYRWSSYNISGPLISIETYKDADSKIEHGYFSFFDRKGIIDSSGHVFEGRRNGEWLYYTDSMTVWQTEEYRHGVMIERKDRDAIKRENEERKNGPDSTAFAMVEREADFKGGEKAWNKYLISNINYPKRAASLNKHGTVVVTFVVTTTGGLADLTITKSIEYSIDEEATSVIGKSPKWTPALQKGRLVKAYRRQPITF
jgi:protein TonB